MTPPETAAAFALTGASGFVGAAVARALRASGHSVHALVRRPEAVGELVAIGATPVAGDLERPATLAGLIPADSVVIHAAAKVDLQGRWRDYERVTIAGTRHVLEAARRARARRFVYLSSGAVYSPPCPPGGYCADRTPAAPASYNPYGRAKLAAEQAVCESCAAWGMEFVVLRLGFLYGPGNDALHRTLARRLVRRKVRLIGGGENPLATLHIDDAVAAILAAATHPAAAGRTYDVASNERVTQRDLLCGLADALGAPLPWRAISLRHAMRVAGWLERIGGWLGRCPAINRASVELFGSSQRMDCSAIRDELGWRPRVRFADGLARLREALNRGESRGASPAGAVR
jgi:nucleoside-diphosphate-sugar epimerase